MLFIFPLLIWCCHISICGFGLGVRVASRVFFFCCPWVSLSSRDFTSAKSSFRHRFYSAARFPCCAWLFWPSENFVAGQIPVLAFLSHAGALSLPIPFQSSFFVKRKSLGRVLLRLGSNPCTRLIFPYCPSVAARFVSGALRFQASRWVESSRARFCCAPLGSGFLRRFAFSFPLARRPWDRYFRAPAAVCSLVFWSSSWLRLQCSISLPAVVFSEQLSSLDLESQEHPASAFG
jgi:hypothetical protein